MCAFWFIVQNNFIISRHVCPPCLRVRNIRRLKGTGRSGKKSESLLKAHRYVSTVKMHFDPITSKIKVLLSYNHYSDGILPLTFQQIYLSYLSDFMSFFSLFFLKIFICSVQIYRSPVRLHAFVSLPLTQRAVVSYWAKYGHEVLVNHLEGLSLPRKSVIKLSDRRLPWT